MTIQELLMQEPYLKTDEAMSGIYVIPQGERGFTSYPVGTNILVNKTNEDGSTTQEEHFRLNEKAVLLTIDQIEGLKNNKYYWKENQAIPYLPTDITIQLESLHNSLSELSQKKCKIINELKEHDYIGIKIAEALLLDEISQISEFKVAYREKILRAKELRTNINLLDSKISEITSQIKVLESKKQNIL